MQKRTASIALAAALALGTVVLAPTSASASSEESRFTSLTNRERTSRGGRSLITKSDLVAIARRHSQRMADRGYIYHNDNLSNEVRGDWQTLGENVGRGGSVESIHNAFMDSAPHRRNILESRFNHVGIGTVIKNGRIYVTEVFAKRGSTPTRRVVQRPRTTRRVATAPRRAAPRPAAPRPRPKPKPAPPPPPSPQTVEILVRLIGLDARRVNPATGAALGL
jgi:hypothetical protein